MAGQHDWVIDLPLSAITADPRYILRFLQSGTNDSLEANQLSSRGFLILPQHSSCNDTAAGPSHKSCPSSLSIGASAGIGIGAAAAILIVAIPYILFYRHRTRRQATEPAVRGAGNTYGHHYGSAQRVQFDMVEKERTNKSSPRSGGTMGSSGSPWCTTYHEMSTDRQIQEIGEQE